MSNIETRIATFTADVDFYCGENQSALMAGEEPDFYPDGFSDLEASGPAIAHCAIIETYK